MSLKKYMTDHRKRADAGRFAQKVGKSFEDYFHKACYYLRVTCIRIPDGCKKVGSGARPKLYPEKTPFDFLITKDGATACIDLKTTEEKNLAYSSIKPHQREALCEIGPSIPAGYLVWFRPTDKVIFFDHEKLYSCMPRESLKPEDGLMIGALNEMDISLILKSNGRDS